MFLFLAYPLHEVEVCWGLYCETQGLRLSAVSEVSFCIR